MELAMRNMERLREKFTHKTVLGLGEFDWVVVRFMLTTAYSAQVRKVNDMEFKISVGKQDGEEPKWANMVSAMFGGCERKDDRHPVRPCRLLFGRQGRENRL